MELVPEFLALRLKLDAAGSEFVNPTLVAIESINVAIAKVEKYYGAMVTVIFDPAVQNDLGSIVSLVQFATSVRALPVGHRLVFDLFGDRAQRCTGPGPPTE